MIKIDYDGLDGSVDYPTHTLTSVNTGRGTGQYEFSTKNGCFLRESVKCVTLTKDNMVIVKLKDQKTWEMKFRNWEDARAVAFDLVV